MVSPRDRDASNNNRLASSSSSSSSPSSSSNNQRCLLQKKNLDGLASLLDALCWAHRHAISAYDLFSYHPASPRPESIAAALNCGSLIARWITTEILQHASLEERVNALDCALILIQKATECRNLELAVTIARGINHPSILRLGATFNALPPARLSMFQSYSSRFFPNGNIRTSPLSSSYPTNALCPLQPLVSAIHRCYLQGGLSLPVKAENTIEASLERYQDIILLLDCYHLPTFILSLGPSFQAVQVQKLRELLSPEAIEIRDLIASYGLQGNEDHLNAISHRLEPSSEAIQFIPQLPPRCQAAYPYPHELRRRLFQVEPHSIFVSQSRIEAKERRKSVKQALSNWKATSVQAEIETVVAAWAGVPVSQLFSDSVSGIHHVK